MSDELISRKTLLDELDSLRIELNGISCRKEFKKTVKEVLDTVKHLIEDQPVAFDKEKVIEELVELRQKEHSDSDEEIEIIDGEEIYDEGRSQGRFEAYHRAIEIIEKGGVE